RARPRRAPRRRGARGRRWIVTGHQARVLVIDDDERIRQALPAALRANGYEVVEAADAETGLDAAAAEAPDLILLGAARPDLDGVEVCRRVRGWSRIPVIVLSAAGDDASKVRALDAGADDYLTKPFSLPELLARVRAALRRAARAALRDDPVV